MSGKEAVLAVTKNLVDLNSALSEQWNTLNIVNKCQEKHLITSGVSSALLDSQTNKSTQDRASQLVSNLQTAIRLQPECLDTFLCILKDEGGVSCSTVAQNIAKEYGLQKLPKYNSGAVKEHIKSVTESTTPQEGTGKDETDTGVSTPPSTLPSSKSDSTNGNESVDSAQGIRERSTKYGSATHSAPQIKPKKKQWFSTQNLYYFAILIGTPLYFVSLGFLGSYFENLYYFALIGTPLYFISLGILASYFDIALPSTIHPTLKYAIQVALSSVVVIYFAKYYYEGQVHICILWLSTIWGFDLGSTYFSKVKHLF